ncbi:hypothetical protein MKK64_10190 [Methylobacterium sp. E-025]|uniref:hypothetical protein n=1 Tax=Methylobacterium sp. E-025 TaxID=2836561 RepID=UPI001FBA22C0|nr:hypothetical protein [Methylobacterium sp. E-025]MCJ2111561.1 hypothetical protein [Methylobacterium sp. E-025]
MRLYPASFATLSLQPADLDTGVHLANIDGGLDQVFLRLGQRRAQLGVLGYDGSRYTYGF